MQAESKLALWCDGLLEAGWLAAVVATPLFFNIHSSRVFEPDKITLLRSIALFMSVIWIVKFVELRGWRSLDWLKLSGPRSMWRMPVVLPVFLLALVYILSSIFSITPTISWVGSYQRLQGTYTTLSYIIIFAMMAATLRQRNQVTRVVSAAIISSIPVALYGMLQHFALDPLPWGGDVQDRVAGHMGNSIFIGAYLIMVAPLTLSRIIDAFTNILEDEELSAADVIRSSIYIFVLAIQIIAWWWSRSRGPFIGLIIGAFAFFLILLVTLRNALGSERRLTVRDVGWAILLVIGGAFIPFMISVLVLHGVLSPLATLGFFAGFVLLSLLVILVLALARRGWSWLWLSLILLALVLSAFLALFQLPKDVAEPYLDTPLIGEGLETMASWRGLPEIGRFGRLLDFNTASGRVRVLIWEGVLDLVAPHEPLQTPDDREDPFNFLRPVLGYGPESMYVAYNRFYQPELATIEQRNASPDRSHNETFDALAITGVLGFAAWQFLYISVFYYGFRWLGVVKDRRDRNVFIALWIAGALLGGVVITQLLGLPFLGIALPFGAIYGLIVYLIYYALDRKIWVAILALLTVILPAIIIYIIHLLASRAGEGVEAEKEAIEPFSRNHLLLIGLVSAVLAHYVEIHFGIAIVASRTYFFVYIALIFLLGYLFPRISAEYEFSDYSYSSSKSEPSQPAPRSKKRRSARTNLTITKKQGGLPPAIANALLLAFLLGILGYNYINYALPEGASLETLPTVGEIFQQSFFINASNNFVDSPFIFILFVMSWAIGGLTLLSEMVKEGELEVSLSSPAPADRNKKYAGYLMIAMGVGSVIGAIIPVFTTGSRGETFLSLAGFWLLLLWAALNVWAFIRLNQHSDSGRIEGAYLALVGICFSFVLLIAGSVLYGLLLLVGSAFLLYFLWDKSWSSLFGSALATMITSLLVGVGYIFLHAQLLRINMTTPAGVTENTAIGLVRALEADQSAALLTGFYVFAFVVIIFLGLFLAWNLMNQRDIWFSSPGILVLLVLLPVAFYGITQTNLKTIQADIVYKRADPWDKQATRTNDPNLWDNAISIYEHAIDIQPNEDFYYLWLGRAYLERSSLAEDPDERSRLLNIAQDRLIRAQEINPLNTDHTANLARLNTRWSELAEGPERDQRIEEAADYYTAAIQLSPQNAVIVNEYARLALVLRADCDKALELYDYSVEVDPYFTESYIERAEAYIECVADRDEETQSAFYSKAAESLDQAQQRRLSDPRRWLQIANLYIILGDSAGAINAYDQAVERGGDNIPQWQLDYQMSQWFLEAGEIELAQDFAEDALLRAPDDTKESIQQYIASLSQISADS